MIISLFFLGCVGEEKVTEAVVVYNKELFFDGYNVYQGTIMDMGGNVILNLTDTQIFDFFDDGSFIAIKGPKGEKLLGRYSLDGKVFWEKNVSVHHEVIITPTQEILVVSREIIRYNNRDVAFDLVFVLNKEGRETDRWSTYENLDHMQQYHEPSFLDEPAPFFNPNCTKMKRSKICYDYYHLNSIQELPSNPLGKKYPQFKKGNWLISLSFVSLVAILDNESKKIVWSFGKQEKLFLHMPRMLSNGNILIFDNGKRLTDLQDEKVDLHSRIIELDPLKKEIVWEYKAEPPEKFFTRWGGTAQRLPNNNTLIVESMNGRAFEITPNKEIVWEWVNPTKNESGHSLPFYRMMRIEKSVLDSSLVS